MFFLTIPVTKETPELLFSFVGMQTTSYNVVDDKEIRIVMHESLEALEEVIVTGMEVIKKERMTGSATVVTAKDLQMQGVTSLDRIFEGRIAGLNSTTLSGAPGRRAKITIRGENNLSGNTEPLWVVDGLPLISGVPKNNTGNYANTIMQDGVGNHHARRYRIHQYPERRLCGSYLRRPCRQRSDRHHNQKRISLENPYQLQRNLQRQYCSTQPAGFYEQQ